MIDPISTGQIKAKRTDEKQRMKQAAIAIDFYNGQQYWHMQNVISYIYPVSWQDIEKYISCSDITRGIIDKKATLFVKPPEMEIATENEALKDAYQQILEDCELWKKLIAADRMAELTGKVGLTLHWHETEQRVVIDLITPDKCYVITDAQDPTKPSVVYYMIGQAQDVNQVTPVNVYGKWTKTGYSEVQLNENFVEIKTVKPEIPNIYGEIPVVWLSPMIEIDSFWIDHGYPLVESNININLRESNLDLALDFQSFSTMVTLGYNKEVDIISSITRRIDLPTNEMGNIQPDVKYITPDAKLQEVSEIIQKKKVASAQEAGISADAFNQNTSNITSGYQLRLTKADIEDNNELKKEIYRQPIMKLLKYIGQCWTAQSKTTAIPIDSEFYFAYKDKQSISNPAEITQQQVVKINAGLMSIADAIRELNPALSQEEAIEEAKRIKDEQRQINGQTPNIPDLGVI